MIEWNTYFEDRLSATEEDTIVFKKKHFNIEIFIRVTRKYLGFRKDGYDLLHVFKKGRTFRKYVRITHYLRNPWPYSIKF